MTESTHPPGETAAALLLGRDEFRRLVARDEASGGDGPNDGTGEGRRRVHVIDVDDAELATLLGPAHALLPEGGPLYIVEGDADLLAICPPEDPPPFLSDPFTKQATLREPQENGFYRRFEHRRPDGSMRRGRRR